MKIIKRFKNIIILTGLLGIGYLFQACSPAYVEKEPVYVPGAIETRPTEAHVWVEGDWVWSRPARNYTHRDGHWTIPKRDREFVPGHWEKTPKGSYWVIGYWQKKDHR